MSFFTRLINSIIPNDKRTEVAETTVQTIIKSLESDGLSAEEIAPTTEFLLLDGKRKIKNRSSVKSKADTMVNQQVNGKQEEYEKPDLDWLNRLFDIVDDVSDDKMQNLWAQILAGETNHPNSYSIKTLDVVKNMDKVDAQLYVESMQFQCFYNFVLTESDNGLDLNNKIKLIDIGLISSENIQRTVEFDKGNNIRLINKDYVIIVDTDKNVKVTLEGHRLTTAGNELLKLLDPIENMALFDYICEKLIKAGAKTVSVNKILSLNGENVSYESTPLKKYNNEASKQS